MTDEEIWKSIPGAAPYQVSNLGRVKSFKLYAEGRLLKPGLASNGYYTVVIYFDDGSKSSRTMHSLVMEAFVGPRPDGMEVCHNNGDRKNAFLINLRYDTPANNQADRYKHGTRSKESDLLNGRKIHEAKIAKYGPNAYSIMNQKGVKTKVERYGRGWAAMSFAGQKYAGKYDL